MCIQWDTFKEEKLNKLLSVALVLGKLILRGFSMQRGWSPPVEHNVSSQSVEACGR